MLDLKRGLQVLIMERDLQDLEDLMVDLERDPQVLIMGRDPQDLKDLMMDLERDLQDLKDQDIKNKFNMYNL